MEEEEKQPQNRRVSNWAFIVMVSIAVVIDLIALVPVVGALVGNVAAILIFGFWFYMLGIPLLGARQFARWGVSFLLDCFSIGYLPGITVGVILVVLLTRAEDRAGHSVLDKASMLKGGQRMLKKGVRRMQNPERTVQARARLERMQQGRAARAVTTQPDFSVNERPAMKDINVPQKTGGTGGGSGYVESETKRAA